MLTPDARSGGRPYGLACRVMARGERVRLRITEVVVGWTPFPSLATVRTSRSRFPLWLMTSHRFLRLRSSLRLSCKNSLITGTLARQRVDSEHNLFKAEVTKWYITVVVFSLYHLSCTIIHQKLWFVLWLCEIHQKWLESFVFSHVVYCYF